MTSSYVTLFSPMSPYFLLCYPIFSCVTLFSPMLPYFLLCHPIFSCVTLISHLSPYFLLCHPYFSFVTLFLPVTLRRSRRVSCEDSSPSAQSSERQNHPKRDFYRQFQGKSNVVRWLYFFINPKNVIIFYD